MDSEQQNQNNSRSMKERALEWTGKFSRSLPKGFSQSQVSVKSLSILSDSLQKVQSGQLSNQTAERISMLVFGAIGATALASLLGVMLEKYIPEPPLSRLAQRSFGAAQQGSPMNYEIIISRNLFSSRPPKASKLNDNGIDMEAEPMPSSLQLDLVGTIIFQNPLRSLATLNDRTENRILAMRAGDSVEGKIEILSVEARRVVFINYQARRKEFIEIPEDPSIRIKTLDPVTVSKPNKGISKVDDQKYVVTRDEINSQMSNFNTLITQARAIPENRGGQMIGFRLMEIQQGSFYEKIGLKRGDIIKSVNGEQITDAAKALSLLQELKSMNSLDIGIERDGKDVPFNYDIRN